MVDFSCFGTATYGVCVGCTGHAPPLYHQDAEGRLAGPISHARDRGCQAAGGHAAESGGPQSPLQNGKPNGRPRSRGDHSRSGLGAPESSGSSNRSEGREFFRRCCHTFCLIAMHVLPAFLTVSVTLLAGVSSCWGFTSLPATSCTELSSVCEVGANLHAGLGPGCQMKPSAYSCKPSRT